MKKWIFSLALCLAGQGLAFSQATGQWKMQPVPLQTRWAKEVTPAHNLTEYPRPQMVRAAWTNLNGLWDYAITPKTAEKAGGPGGKILVPYPIESALSGVKKTLQPDQLLWYRRKFIAPDGKGRLLLHFGAVDYQCWVYVNGKAAGNHEGGYNAFTLDITDLLRAGENELKVKVWDPSDKGYGPHGKQVLDPRDIYYTPSSGIWQTVWLERVPEKHIDRLSITPDVDRSVVRITVHGSQAPVVITFGGKQFKGQANRDIIVPVKNAQLWSPGHPYLYDFSASLGQDKVDSYFGMRKISVSKDAEGTDRICLNNKPYYNLGTLDQGFWPDGLYTAPTDEALAFDIKAIKAMGFNTIRKHIKVEPARWYYWADKLGMLVWQDMVNPNQGLPSGAKEAFEKQSAEEVAQLHNYPSIVTWVLFNEKWGQYDQERLTKWLKAADPSRIVNGHTGEYLYVNEQLRSPSPNAYVGADMTDVHAYPDPMNSLKMDGKARVCGEFGGIGVFIPDHQWLTGSAWGYIQEKPAALKAKYTIMNQHLKLFEAEGLSGSIYTQPFDVEGEQNGLMTYDREIVKIPFAELRKIHSALNPDANKNVPMVTANDADLTDPAMTYSKNLELYIQGKQNSTFLKQLMMQAKQIGDKAGARRFSDAYLGGLKAPYTTEQLKDLLQLTTSTRDEGFAIIQQHTAEINRELGPRQAETKLMNLIYADKIAPVVGARNANPDWNALSLAVKPYGPEGEEILLHSKMFFHLNHQQWDDFVRTGYDYINKYADHIPANDLNEWAWAAFTNVNSAELLLKAAEWSKLSVRDREEAAFMDTQANLLYKAGKKQEGIKLQEKAVSLSANPELKATLDKMKREFDK